MHSELRNKAYQSFKLANSIQSNNAPRRRGWSGTDTALGVGAAGSYGLGSALSGIRPSQIGAGTSGAVMDSRPRLSMDELAAAAEKYIPRINRTMEGMPEGTSHVKNISANNFADLSQLGIDNILHSDKYFEGIYGRDSVEALEPLLHSLERNGHLPDAISKGMPAADLYKSLEDSPAKARELLHTLLHDMDPEHLYKGARGVMKAHADAVSKSNELLIKARLAKDPSEYMKLIEQAQAAGFDGYNMFSEGIPVTALGTPHRSVPLDQLHVKDFTELEEELATSLGERLQLSEENSAATLAGDIIDRHYATHNRDAIPEFKGNLATSGAVRDHVPREYHVAGSGNPADQSGNKLRNLIHEYAPTAGKVLKGVGAVAGVGLLGKKIYDTYKNSQQPPPEAWYTHAGNQAKQFAHNAYTGASNAAHGAYAGIQNRVNPPSSLKKAAYEEAKLAFTLPYANRSNPPENKNRGLHMPGLSGGDIAGGVASAGGIGAGHYLASSKKLHNTIDNRIKGAVPPSSASRVKPGNIAPMAAGNLTYVDSFSNVNAANPANIHDAASELTFQRHLLQQRQPNTSPATGSLGANKALDSIANNPEKFNLEMFKNDMDTLYHSATGSPFEQPVAASKPIGVMSTYGLTFAVPDIHTEKEIARLRKLSLEQINGLIQGGGATKEDAAALEKFFDAYAKRYNGSPAELLKDMVTVGEDGVHKLNTEKMKLFLDFKNKGLIEMKAIEQALQPGGSRSAASAAHAGLPFNINDVLAPYYEEGVLHNAGAAGEAVGEDAANVAKKEVHPLWKNMAAAGVDSGAIKSIGRGIRGGGALLGAGLLGKKVYDAFNG